jgi:hypothetical protein
MEQFEVVLPAPEIIYVISQNNIPIKYCLTSEEACIEAYNLANDYINNNTQNNTKLYMEFSNNSYVIYSKNNYYIISFESTEMIYSIDTVTKNKQKQPLIKY